ncbi:arylsulfatase [Pseudomonas fontis]|uniref:Arylsulfatase n=1 Tax=Pseudomonas fontis TaxID=2942633 RepID=A0ABT5NY20_9PSED|nr:arylsulfatase [Pseudomonas fontis]MDD0972498.1 arylsulfatase [Pseudomonas fontis]MDD0993022.1 arylsulfatase [Pseudomonas fontis]
MPVFRNTLCGLALAAMAAGTALAADQPNIVVIMIDDMAPMDVSAYNRGLGAVTTPNIDRIAKEGMMVSDYYAQPSCTAGRAAFITGQYPIRTGLTTVGQPGAKIGLQDSDVTLAQLLKAEGYATGMFGKSHVGDRNEYLPTAHGFDEFYGFLYHLNVMEIAQMTDFPKQPNFPGIPRNMIHAVATSVDDATEDPRWGRVGKQKISDEGPLTAERMKTVDDQFTDLSIDWIKKQKAADKPFFLWYNPSRLHQKIHVSDEWLGKSGHTEYADAVMQLDSLVGKLLKTLDQQGLADNTIVLFTSDNGVNLSHWPDSGAASFRGEKGLTWDGGFRVPMLVRWPGKIKADSWTGEFMTAEDWLPTLMAAAGKKDIKADLLKGLTVGDKTFRNHLDGYDQLDMLTRPDGKSRRHEFFYFAETSMNAIRVDQWKVHTAIKDKWMEAAQQVPGGLVIDIKLDPYERSPETGDHFRWQQQHSWLIPVMAPYLKAFSQSMKDFPPSQKGAAGVGMASMAN